MRDGAAVGFGDAREDFVAGLEVGDGGADFDDFAREVMADLVGESVVVVSFDLAEEGDVG